MRVASLILALAVAACGRSQIAFDDDGSLPSSTSTDSGGAGGVGGTGSSVGGSGGAAPRRCSQLLVQGPVSPLGEAGDKRSPRRAPSLGDYSRISVAFAEATQPPELHHSFVLPFEAWPPPPAPTPKLLVGDGGASFELERSSAVKVGFLFTHAQGVPLPGVYYAGEIDPLSDAPIAQHVVDDLGTRVTLLRHSGQSQLLAGWVRAGPAGPDTMHAISVISHDTGGQVTVLSPILVGCGQPSPVGDAVVMNGGWLMAASSAVFQGMVGGCNPPGPTAGIQLAHVSTAGDVSWGDYLVYGPIAALRMVPNTQGAWVFWTTLQNAPAAVRGVRVDPSGTLIDGPFDVSSAEMASADGLLAASLMASANRALVTWHASTGPIVLRTVELDGSMGTPLSIDVPFPPSSLELQAADQTPHSLLAYSAALLPAGPDPGSEVIRVARVECAR